MLSLLRSLVSPRHVFTIAFALALMMTLFPGRTAAQDIKPLLDEWNAHYKWATSQDLIRPGNEPQIMDHGCITEHAIVLLHPVGGSPHFMRALGRQFFEDGFTVIIPMLPGHGIKRPVAMRDAKFGDWIAETEFALTLAHKLAAKVSVAGESIGGALALNAALVNPKSVDGALYLFSPTLLLPPEKAIYQIVDKQLRTQSLLYKGFTPGPDTLEGIGANPYRFAKMFNMTSSQMAQLARAIQRRYKTEALRYTDIAVPVFLAHSEEDRLASIKESERLARNHPKAKDQVEFIRFDKASGVGPTGMLLSEDIVWKKGRKDLVLEAKNPKWNALASSIREFTTKHVTLGKTDFCKK